MMKTEEKLSVGLYVLFTGREAIYTLSEVNPYMYECIELGNNFVTNLNRNHVRPYFLQKGDKITISNVYNNSEIVVTIVEILISENLTEVVCRTNNGFLVQYDIREIAKRLINIL